MEFIVGTVGFLVVGLLFALVGFISTMKGKPLKKCGDCNCKVKK